MDKAIEAAAKALWPTAHKDMSDFMLHALKDCLRAYLSALKEDPDVVERVARAIHSKRQVHGFGGEAAWQYEPVEIRAIHLSTARAALSAL